MQNGYLIKCKSSLAGGPYVRGLIFILFEIRGVCQPISWISIKSAQVKLSLNKHIEFKICILLSVLLSYLL